MEHFFHDGRHIIPEHTGTGALAAQTTYAKLDFLATKGNLLYLIARCHGTFGKFFSQHFAVGPCTETGGNNNYLFHRSTVLSRFILKNSSILSQGIICFA